jgi:hypothetical protein
MRKFDWEDDVPVTNAKHVAPAHDVMDKHAGGGDLNTVKKAPTEDVNMRKFDWEDDVPVHSIRQEEDLPTLQIKHVDTHGAVGLNGESNGQEASFSSLKKAPTDDSLQMRKFDWEDDVPVHGMHNASSGHYGGVTLHAEAVPIFCRLAAVDEEVSDEISVVFNKFDCVAFKNKQNDSALNNGAFVVSVGSQMQLPTGWTLQPLGQHDMAKAGLMPEFSVGFERRCLVLATVLYIDTVFAGIILYACMHVLYAYMYEVRPLGQKNIGHA